MPHDGEHRFTEAVLDVVAAIPPGRVMTYGDVAATLGSRAAQAVGAIMARHGSSVPWWRVVRANGEPAPGKADRALPLLRADGTPLLPHERGERVNLRVARHRA